MLIGQVDRSIFAKNADLEEKCATIDRRGLRENVESAYCREAAHFICELQATNFDEPADACKVGFDATA